jgi:hypothetical protein
MVKIDFLKSHTTTLEIDAAEHFRRNFCPPNSLHYNALRFSLFFHFPRRKKQQTYRSLSKHASARVPPTRSNKFDPLETRKIDLMKTLFFFALIKNLHLVNGVIRKPYTQATKSPNFIKI